jgi:uncharacterized membrane protein YfcA
LTFLLGFLIAAAVGLTGVGAGTLTAPLLILVFHQPPAAAVGTALVFTMAIKVAVAPVYMKRRQVNLRTLGAMCGGGVPGVLAGTLLLSYLDVHRYQRAVLLLVGAMVAGMALYNLYRMLRRGGAVTGTNRLGWVAAVAVPIGAEVGFSSAGAGAMGSLVLLNLTSLTPAQVVGTDLCFGLVVSSVGGAWHLSTGDYNSILLRGLVLGGLAGVLLGAWLSFIVPARPLRAVLSVALFGLGLELCWKAWS